MKKTMPKLLDREVGPIGYGLMGLTWRNGPPPPLDQSFAAMRAALKNGCESEDTSLSKF